MTLVEKEYKGKGIAKSATILLLKYAFSSLKLHTVYLLTETENAAAQKLFQQCGFIKRDAFFLFLLAEIRQEKLLIFSMR